MKKSTKSTPDILESQVPEKQQDFGENRVKERKQASDNRGNAVTDSFQPTPEPLRHDFESCWDSLYDSPKADRAMLNGLQDRLHQFLRRTERSHNTSWQLRHLPLIPPAELFPTFLCPHGSILDALGALLRHRPEEESRRLPHKKLAEVIYLLRSPPDVIHSFGVPGLPAPPAASAPEREEVDNLVMAVVGREAERQLAARVYEELNEVGIAQRGGELERGAVRCSGLPAALLAVFLFSVDAVAVDIGAQVCTIRTLPTDTAARSGVWPVAPVVLTVTRLCSIITATASSFFVVMALKECTMS